jgi:atypical dual specificity phosphatase
MDYAQVTYRLYVGSHPQSIGDIETLEKVLASTAILNLQTDEDMAAVNLNWQRLESHYKTCAVKLHRMPMKEEQVVLRENLLRCVDLLDQLLTGSHTVYLHCTSGIGRSPTVAIGYLHCCLGWEMDAAVRYMKQLRRCSPHLEALRLAILDQEKRESFEKWTL